MWRTGRSERRPGSSSRPWWRLGWLLAFVMVGALDGSAQTPSEHDAHHPGGSGTPPPTSQSAVPPAPAGPATPPTLAAPPTGAKGGMGMGGMGMGEMMGARPPKELYPTLMDLPALSAEQRQTVEAQARARISQGIDAIAAADNALRHANAAGDMAGAAEAARRLRDGAGLVSSGAAVLKALGDGRAPRDIARDWFKQQMNLGPAAQPPAPEGALGLSWFHAVSMGLLSSFLVAMAALYIARLRRANALVERLGAAAAPGVVAAPAPSATTLDADTSPLVGGTARPVSGPSRQLAPATAQTESAPLGAPGLWKGKLRVAAIFRETPDVKTFRLKEPDGGAIPFSFVPGQFLTFSAEIDGELVRRSYTIASSAAQTSYVEATIKREAPGIFSDYMHDKIVEGDLVDVMGPSGAFTFRGTEADSVVLIGGGVGITPLMAAIRYLTDTAWPGEIFLVYGVRTTDDFIFRDELEYLQRRHTKLRVTATMVRSAGSAWMGPQGHITREMLAQAVPEIGKRRIHLCGPPGMMQAIRGILAELGVSADQIRTEAFGPARGAVPPPGVTVVMPASPRAAPAGEVAAPSPAGVPTIGPATAQIRFARSDKVAALSPDQTVLEAAESIGVPIDYACRVGVCGTCKTRLLEGKVTMEVEDALSAADKAANIILACQARSTGNLVVEA